MDDTCLVSVSNTYDSLNQSLTNVCSVSPSIKKEDQSETLNKIIYSPIRRSPLRADYCPDKGWCLEFRPMAWTSYCWDCSLID